MELEQNSYFSHSLVVLCINSSPLHGDSSKEQLRVLLGLEKSLFYAGSNLSVALFGIGDPVGASPSSEQIMQILCVLSVGLVIHFVLKMLHHARRMGHLYLQFQCWRINSRYCGSRNDIW